MDTVERTGVDQPSLEPRGAVVADRDGTYLRFARDLPFPLDDVWSALTAPERLARWFGQLTGDPGSGRVEILMTAEDGAEPDPVDVHECSAPHRLRITLRSEDGDWPLELTLTEAEGATRLVFLHRLGASGDAGCLGPGWELYLDRLAAVLAGAPVPDDFDRYYPALAVAYRRPGTLVR